jgi:hypothetical protein
MYTYCADELACLTVSIWSGVSSDADYLRAIEVFETMDRVAAKSGKKNVHVSVVEAGYPQPPAVWRKKIGAVNRGMSCREYYFALVTQSALVRGVFTAVRWLVGAREGHHSAAVHSFAEAAARVRRSSGEAYPGLEMLHVKACAALRAHSAPAHAAQR